MKTIYRLIVSSLVFVLLLTPSVALANSKSVLSRLNSVATISSTVPQNGDVNPYGIVIVPRTIGSLVAGNLLISNFNNSANSQGTGSTIVEISPGGSMKQFAQINASALSRPCPGGVGLTTALVVLHSGWVIVGSLPTSDGSSATASAGCLIVLNSMGQAVETISGSLINGPWDMTAVEKGSEAFLFISNVLNGTVAASPNTVDEGTIVRLKLEIPKGKNGMPAVRSMTKIASGFPERTDPNALVIGPTGLGLAHDGTLYVADTLNNRIAAISDALDRKSSAGTGRTVSSGGSINGPLGLALASDGEILVANGGDGNIVEITPGGDQVGGKTVDASGAGALFGLVVSRNDKGVYFVDDSTNTLDLLH